ncbi:pectinesterase family protein [Vibrio quintilis]|uniref:Pectinesterase n=1 Tax=Vibrio quintilis TaxID=1117707 RepID=A0A1M7YTM9_9VIBR|nr:pectinesterase family protein [Vibrio quintilis]SHO55959.1 Pectinesterase A precursor [Vibrio quintilis]
MSLFSFYDVIVSSDGDGDFRSVQQAIENAPQDDSEYVIFIRKGVYQESFEITRPNVVLIGEDRDQTIITASVANGMLDSSGRKFATFGSRTISVNAADFSATSLTIANGFDFPGNQKKPDDDPTKLTHTQAVALLVAHQGDRVQLHNVRLESYHDTLYLYAGRTYIHQSLITGTVDFIFGGGTAMFEDCDIVARYRDDVSRDEPYGYLVAPCTSIEQPFGFVFKNCRLSKEERVPAESYGLGRPWHPTTQFDDGSYADPDAIGHAAFIHCHLDDHLYGWDKMGGRNKHQETIWFYPEDARFWEFRSTGPGADDAHRPQLNTEQMNRYDVGSVFSGWQPEFPAGKERLLQRSVAEKSIFD